MEILNTNRPDEEKIRQLDLLPKLRLYQENMTPQSATLLEYLSTRITIYGWSLVKTIKTVKTDEDKQIVKQIVEKYNPWCPFVFTKDNNIYLCKEYNIKLKGIYPLLAHNDFDSVNYVFKELNYKINDPNELHGIQSDKVLMLAIDHNNVSKKELLNFATLSGFTKSVDKLLSMGAELTDNDKINLIRLCNKKLLKKYKIDYHLYEIEPDEDNDVNFKIMKTYDIDHTPFVETIKGSASIDEFQELINMGHTITAYDIDNYYDRICQHGRVYDGGKYVSEILLFAIRNNLELNYFVVDDFEIDCDCKDEYEAELQLYYDFIKNKKLEIVDKFIIPDLAKIIVDFL